MVFNVGLVIFSLVLLVYWFRYTCLLMLRTKPVRHYSKQVAAANQLKVFEVQHRLTGLLAGDGPKLDELQQMLDRDYRLIVYLMDHAANFQTAGYQLEHIMLKMDYKVVKYTYAIGKRISLSQGSRHLAEMADIITHFANVMGERAASATAQ